MAKKKLDDPLDRIALAMGMSLPRALDLAQPMRMEVSRLGYEDEGLRLTLSIDSPYHFDSEVKLSRADAEWLIRRLREELDDPKNANLPKGKAPR